ncbi:MAG TPA: class I SAM-dependent methyltransferase [Anaerolineales bacterium]|nr:class I SAM-dependent methyltransferase [Anaerolineales bacterium]
MPISVDPEGNETHALFELTDLDGHDVLEIGCGDGRLTWRYASRAAHVTAIDPYEGSIKRAKASVPEVVRDRVDIQRADFERFAASSASSAFDTVILSWALC